MFWLPLKLADLCPWCMLCIHVVHSGDASPCTCYWTCHQSIMSHVVPRLGAFGSDVVNPLLCHFFSALSSLPWFRVPFFSVMGTENQACLKPFSSLPIICKKEHISNRTHAQKCRKIASLGYIKQDILYYWYMQLKSYHIFIFHSTFICIS